MSVTPEVQPPMCFGSGYGSKGNACASCAFRTKCLDEMGWRENGIRLPDLKFDLSPSPGGMTKVAILEALYHRCFWRVFEKPPRDRIGRIPDSYDRLAAAAEEARADMESFMLCCMKMHRVGMEEMVRLGKGDGWLFHADMLFGEGAIGNAIYLRKIANKIYGAGLGYFLRVEYGLESGGVAKEKGWTCNLGWRDDLKNSEVIAGKLIVARRMQGFPVSAPQLIAKHELELAPVWLAIESTFEPTLRAHLRQPFGSPEIRRHRRQAAEIFVGFQLNKNMGLLARRVRSGIMHQAIKFVIHPLWLFTGSFGVANAIVTDAFVFWTALGNAMKSGAKRPWIELKGKTTNSVIPCDRIHQFMRQNP